MSDVVGGNAVDDGAGKFGGEKANDHEREVQEHAKNLEDQAKGLKTLANPLPGQKVANREN